MNNSFVNGILANNVRRRNIAYWKSLSIATVPIP